MKLLGNMTRTKPYSNKIRRSYAAAFTAQSSKMFPRAIFCQRCFPSVGWSPAFPWSFVPFQNPRVRRSEGKFCDIRRKFLDCFHAIQRLRLQSSVIGRHICFRVLPIWDIVPWRCPIMSARRPTTMRINRQYSTSNLAR